MPVNEVQLRLELPARAEDKILTIILCKEADREEMARRFCRLKSFEAVEETYRKRLKELEDKQQATVAALTKLQQERDQAKAAAEKASEELATNQPGRSSDAYQQAKRLSVEGKVDEAIKLLDVEKLRQSVVEARQTIVDAVQAWLLTQGHRRWVRLHEKGGKEHDVPCHHNLDHLLDEYIEAAGIASDDNGYLFRTAAVKSGRLTDKPRLIQRRAKAAGIQTRIGNHTFRATGITAYLKNSGKLEVAQQIANHESPRTTKLYDRRHDEISLDEIEKISV